MASRWHKVKGEVTKWLEKFEALHIRYSVVALAGSMVIWLLFGIVWLVDYTGVWN